MQYSTYRVCIHDTAHKLIESITTMTQLNSVAGDLVELGNTVFLPIHIIRDDFTLIYFTR